MKPRMMETNGPNSARRIKRATPFVLIVVAGLTLFGGARLRAAEPYLDFLQALKNERYFDYALIYLDQIAAKETTPAEMKLVIPYHRAMVLLEDSRQPKSPERQYEQLNQAQALLDQFVRDNANHPNAADANSDRAQIVMTKAMVETRQSRSPANQGSRGDFQTRARGFIEQARAVFQTAFDQHKAAFAKFPKYIDEQKDPKQYEAKNSTEEKMLTAEFNLAKCTYEEAQTYDRDSLPFKQNLSKAADEFNKIHVEHRTVMFGPFARAWQGKCYEEQGDLQKAMGIYKELLDTQGSDPSVVELRNQAFLFNLICMNNKDLANHQVVVDSVEEWLKKNGAEARTSIGLGIQWEQARAYEALGDSREAGAADRDRMWRQARTVAQQVARFQSEYKDAALGLAQRMTVKLGGKTKDPASFDEAFGIGKQAFAAAQDLNRDAEEAAAKNLPSEEVAKFRAEAAAEMAEATKYLELALALGRKTDDRKSQLDARYYLANTHFMARRHYEATVLAQSVARLAVREDGSLGVDAAYLGMAAMMRAFSDNKAPTEQKEEDLRLVLKAYRLLVDRWPTSDKANDARLSMGRIYSQIRQPEKAAEIFLQVPQSDAKFSEAQMLAGQAFWNAYLTANRASLETRQTPEQLAEMLKTSEQYLTNGISKLSAATPADAASPLRLITAKVTLAQIQLSQGRDAESLKLFNDEPHPITKAISVLDETNRPADGLTSRRFAVECYKLLLRAYIGTGNLDKARETMQILEAIVGAGNAGSGLADITELYVSLGRQLKEELDRVQKNGETIRFNQLMQAFETFLNDMSSRKEGHSFGSLSWIGETLFVLAETSSADAARAAAFYDRAGASFADILEKAKVDPTFATPEQLFGVKVRQIRVHRLKKEFAKAETLLQDILKERKSDKKTERPQERANELRLQVAAAELYQDWGGSGQADAKKKLVVAISGDKGGGIWGWGEISRLLQKQKELNENPTTLQSYLDARYNITSSRLKYAREVSPKEKEKHLEGCRKELVSTSSGLKEFPEEQYIRFNKLYREVLQEGGRLLENLPRTKDVPVAPPPKPTSEPDPKEAEPEKPTAIAKEEPKHPAGSDSTTMLLFGATFLLGIGGAVWAILKGAKSRPKRKPLGGATSSTEPTFAGIVVSEPAANAEFVVTESQPTARTRSGTNPGKSPSRSPTKSTTPGAGSSAAGSSTGQPRPRPKPPQTPDNS